MEDSVRLNTSELECIGGCDLGFCGQLRVELAKIPRTSESALASGQTPETAIKGGRSPHSLRRLHSMAAPNLAGRIWTRKRVSWLSDLGRSGPFSVGRPGGAGAESDMV